MSVRMKTLCLLALCLLGDGAHSLTFPGRAEQGLRSRDDNTAAQPWQVESAIAQKRRQNALDAFFPVPAIDEDDLPLDLRSYPKTSGLLTKDELEIIDTDAGTLLAKIKERELTSVAITEAFSKAAVVAQNVTNCVTEVLFEEGLERAQYLDNYLERTGEVLGPLHGLPISLKDSYLTPSHPSSIGMAFYANVGTGNETHSVVVDMLRDMGAVFYVKTNVPTGMMMAETLNNVWGETRNPLHKKLTPGGSTGGEGALIAMRGSPLGIGTDIGGSVRIPSGFCHIYGLKPSFGRFPTWGVRAAIPGQDIVASVSGPMSRDLSSVKLFAETILDAAPWTLDPKLLPIPWRKDVIQPKGRPLRLALLPCNDGVATCYPPVERALSIIRRMLEDAGHEIIDWEPKRQAETEALAGGAFQQTGGDALFAKLKAFDEPLLGTMSVMFPGGVPSNATLGPEKLREMILERNQLQKDFLDQWMATDNRTEGDSSPIDGLISPIAVAPAPRLQQDPKLIYGGFTAFANVLDLPSMSFPVTYADEKLDPERGDEWTPNSERDEMIQADYEADFYHDAPVSLQLHGKRLEDEKVVEMVEIVSELINFQHRA